MDQKPSSSKEIKIEKSFKSHEIRVSDEKILKTFSCPICLELVWDPIFCNKCGKPSCKACIKSYYQNKNQQGYPCVFKCGGTGYRKITNAEKEYIDYIKLKCRHNGCLKFVNYTDYKDHLLKCKYRIYHCDNKPCDVEGFLNVMEAHAKRCEFREIECEKCKKKIIFNTKEAHINQDCPEATVSCIYCSKKMKRIDYLKNHQSKDANCLKKLVDAYSKKISENDVELKRKNDKIDLLNKTINENEKKLKEKEKEIQSYKTKNSLLKKKNAERKKIIEEFRLFIKDGYNRFKDNENIEDQPLNINREIQKKETQNIFLNTDTNFNPKKEIQSRNRNSIAINNNINMTERKDSKALRRFNSEANFENYLKFK